MSLSLIAETYSSPVKNGSKVEADGGVEAHSKAIENQKKKLQMLTRMYGTRSNMSAAASQPQYPAPVEKPHTWACDICTKEFELPWKLNRHVQGAHSKKKLSLAASASAIVTQSDVSAAASQPQAPAPVEKPHTWTCDICTKEFSLPWKLNRHVRGAHSKKKLSLAASASAIVTQSDVSAAASQTQSPAAVKKRHTCDICAKGFVTPSKLTRHLRSHSKKKLSLAASSSAIVTQSDVSAAASQPQSPAALKKRHTCDICAKGFVTPSNLTRHLRSHSRQVQHTRRPPKGYQRIRKYKCPLCQFSFKKEYDLKRHGRSHRKDKLTMNKEENSEENTEPATGEQLEK